MANFALVMDLKNVITISLILFAVIDVVGSIPIIISLREKIGHIQSEKTTIFSGALMIGFLFFGELILKFIGVDISSFAIAGSIVIFLLGLELVLNVAIFKQDGDSVGSLVPLGFPLLAGAGTLTTLVTLDAAYGKSEIIVGIIINLFFIYLVLKSTNWLSKVLGKSGLAILRKVFGIVLLSIAVKIFKENIILP